MALKLTQRQHTKVGLANRRVEVAETGKLPRQVTSFEARGVDFATPCVPKSTIPPRERFEQPGSDLFRPGVGQAWLYRIGPEGHIEQWLKDDGTGAFADVYNFSEETYEPNSLASFGSAYGGAYSGPANSPDPEDLIGPETPVLIAIMTRTGKLVLPPDEKGAGGDMLIGMTDTEFPKHTGVTPGSGLVSIWIFLNGTIGDSGTDQLAYSNAPYSIPAGELVLLSQEQFSDRWMIQSYDHQTITGDTGSEILYPFEDLELVGGGGTAIDVQKAADIVTATITAGAGAMVKIAKQDSGAPIAAFDGIATPGTGPVTVWDFVNGNIAATAEVLTAVNMYDYPCPEDEFIILRPTEVGGGGATPGEIRWLIDMDGETTIEGWIPGVDGQETLFEYDTLQFVGDRDTGPVIGDIIDIQITKAGDVVTVNFNAIGDLFRFSDERSSTVFENVALAETIALDSIIDETMLAKFSEFRLGASLLQIAFGKMLDITGDTGAEVIFPLEELSFVGAGGIQVDVTKAADRVEVKIDSPATSGLPIGSVIQGTKAPLADVGGMFIDRDGFPDTDWALMDGSSNSSPGSGIDMRDFFSRGQDDLGSAGNTPYGREAAGSADDQDVVDITVAEHTGHTHQINDPAWTTVGLDHTGATLTCVKLPAGPVCSPFCSTEPRLSDLDCDATWADAAFMHDIEIIRGGGTTPGLNPYQLEMLPPYKQLHYYERVA